MRKSSVAVLATLLLAGLAGCSNPEPASGGTTITFAHWGNNEEAATLKSMVAAFQQANPGITVEVNWIQSDYEQKLQTTIAGGKAPTVAQMSNTSLAGFAGAFRVADVDPGAFYSPNAARSMQIAGKYRAVPFVVKPKVMAVNAAVFKAANVTPPTAAKPLSTDEFADLAQRVTTGTAPKKTYGSARLWYNGWLVAEGGSFYNNDGTACTLNSPQAVKTANDLIKAQSPTGFAPTKLDAEGQDMFDWLGIGRLAMQPDFGPWDIAKLTALNSPDINLVPVPGAGAPIEFNGLGIATSAPDAQAKAAQTFVKFMSTSRAAQDLLTTSKSSLGVPVVKESLDAFLKAAPKLNLQAFVNAVDQSVVSASVAKDPQIRAAFDDVVYSRTALGAGREDPAKVLADFNATCQSTLQSK
jgi:multiple sugar transport system substrate-binding protein